MQKIIILPKWILPALFALFSPGCFSQNTSTDVDAIGSFGGISVSANYQEMGTGGESMAVGLTQSPDYANGAGFIFVLLRSDVPVDQELQLQNGWNIFSLNVTPDNTSMISILQPLIVEGSLVKVQNETGASIEKIPGSSSWIDNIHTWQATEGYKIRVNTSTVLTVNGMPITQLTDILLLSGWNIMGYPSSGSQNAMTALQDLITSGNLLKVQDETGAAIEPLPDHSGWINNIGNFEPGEGYKVRVSANSTITIDPAASGSLKSAVPFPAEPLHFIKSWKGNGYNHMNVYLHETEDGVSALEPGDEIGVYDGDACVGAMVVTGRDMETNLFPVAVAMDDPTTNEPDGFVRGNPMKFRIWKNTIQAESELTAVSFYPGYNDRFEEMGTTFAGIRIPNLTSKTALGIIYPNPFQQETRVGFQLGSPSSVDITVYDLMGKPVRNLISAHLPEGSHTVRWDATDDLGNRMPPGMYVCRMVAGDTVGVKVIEVDR